jgi:hypothetical protein
MDIAPVSVDVRGRIRRIGHLPEDAEVDHLDHLRAVGSRGEEEFSGTDHGERAGRIAPQP